jgi:Tol biopolymer transport system component
MKTVKIFTFLALIVSLAACSSNPTQPPVLVTATLPPPSITILPQAAETPTTRSSPAITALPQATETPAEPVSETMPSVTQYGLTGRLVLIRFNQSGNRLIELNLQSGEIRTLFQAPENSWLAEAVVSPDEQQILLTYAPPPPDGESQFGYSDLYLLPYDGSSQPQAFLTRTDPDESFFFPTWAPDGKSAYFTHLYVVDPNSQVRAYQNDIERASLNGETSALIDHALWPAISPDGSRLAYLYADPVTLGNDLYLADPDGGGQVPVLQPGFNPPVDAHLFTLDGSQLIFSMVNPQLPPASSWLERLFGVEVASAHSVPSDWYRVPTGGGLPERLTGLGDLYLNGDLSPDGSQMAFISASGLYVMNIDGSDLTMLSSEVFVGTVSWVP